MTPKRLTVGITYHNECELLSSCVKSLLSQIDNTVEVLIYDDASEFPARGYVLQSENVRIIRGEANLGPAKARNLILKEAKGEYIHFHDSDDWFNEKWFEKVSSHFGKSDAIFTEVTSYRGSEVFLARVMEVAPLADNKSLLKFAIEGFILVPSGTYRKTLVEQLGGYREELWQSEDWDFHVRMALKNPVIEVIDEPLVYIRIRQESRSQNSVETSTDTLKSIEYLATDIPQSYHRYLSDKAAKMGTKLFLSGQKKMAKNAFRLSRSLGPSQYQWQRKSYRIIAKFLGQEWAERISKLGRSLKARLTFHKRIATSQAF